MDYNWLANLRKRRPFFPISPFCNISIFTILHAMPNRRLINLFSNKVLPYQNIWITWTQKYEHKNYHDFCSIEHAINSENILTIDIFFFLILTFANLKWILYPVQNFQQPLGYKRRSDFDFQKVFSNNRFNNYQQNTHINEPFCTQTKMSKSHTHSLAHTSFRNLASMTKILNYQCIT